jgi:hypothetical protein
MGDELRVMPGGHTHRGQVGGVVGATPGPGSQSSALTEGDAQLVLKEGELSGSATAASLTAFGSVVALPLGGETDCAVDPATGQRGLQLLRRRDLCVHRHR